MYKYLKTKFRILKNYGWYFAPRTFEFMEQQKPLVSLIIPVYNKYKMTRECLYSILKNTDNVSYEIIVADDNSKDLTQKISNYIKGIQHIRTSSNLGFGRNCMNAAKHARGKYIAFLNNDMLFYKNWLKPIIDLLETDKTVGVAGPTIISPKGEINEMGAIVFNDGSICQIGRHCKYNPSLLETLNHDFDYKSGCSIVLSKNLFDEIGGFDELFYPAFYEDTDLCFKIKQKGLKIANVLQSRVMHFETITYNDNSLNEKFTANRNKFIEKWRANLNNQVNVNFKKEIFDRYQKYLSKYN